LRRTIRPLILLCGAVVILIVALVPIQQFILRRSAANLLSEIRRLELRKSTWSDAENLFRRWGWFGSADGRCTREACRYRIGISDALSLLIMPGECPDWVRHVYAFLGGRLVWITADVTVLDGLVWGKSFDAILGVPAERDPKTGLASREYALVARSGSVSRFSPARPGLGPGNSYVIGSPAGCMGCLEVYAWFTPYAAPADVQRLMDFDLSCITRRRACRERGEIMPTAWKECLAASEHNRWARFESCDYPLGPLGRDTENAIVGEIVSSRVEQTSSGANQVVQVRLVQRLKGAAFWKENASKPVAVPTRWDGMPLHNIAQNIARGVRLILLFRGEGVWLDQCGFIEFTPQNLADVEAGIDQDFLGKREASGKPLPGGSPR